MKIILKKEISERWENGDWENDQKTRWEYDENNALVEFLVEFWENGQWTNYLIVNITNDENSLPIYDIARIWESDQWVNSDSTTYEHDENGNMIKADLKLWIDNEWVNWGLNQYAYDANNQKIMHMHSSWDGIIYFPYSLDSTEYNEAGLETVIKHFTFADGIWQKQELAERNYDELNTLIEEYIFKWENEGWVNAYYFEYEFEDGLIKCDKLEWIDDEWVPSNSDFTHPIKIIINGETILIHKGYIIENSVMVYYSQTNVGVIENTNSYDYTIYPNPAKESIIIKASENSNINLVEIINTEGKVMFTEQLSSQMAEHKVQVSELPKGLYLVKLYFEDGVEVQKIVVEK